MIGNPVLGKVIRANSLRTVHPPNLALAGIARDRIAFFLLAREQARAQNAHRRFLVLDLALLVLTRDDDSRRNVRDSNSRVGRVDRLATGATGAEDIDTYVIWADRDLFGFVNLGKNEDTRRRGVNSALRFGCGDSLNAMNSAFVFEFRPRAVSGLSRVGLYCELYIFEAAEIAVGAVENLDAPTTTVGVLGVHAKQVGGEQSTFRTTFTTLNLHDDVSTVVGITRDEQTTKLLFELGDARFHWRNLRSEHLVILGEFLGCREIVAGRGQRFVRCDDLIQLRITAIEFLRACRIRVNRRISEFHLKSDVFRDEAVD
ncbi:unannotated protein [freshwater metagenome]|uniref:Unannotated protein n=1 Tax=freshwater metagenome TaxID=449393 RepID=A0A6J6EWW9_9ZZZZ